MLSYSKGYSHKIYCGKKSSNVAAAATKALHKGQESQNQRF